MVQIDALVRLGQNEEAEKVRKKAEMAFPGDVQLKVKEAEMLLNDYQTEKDPDLLEAAEEILGTMDEWMTDEHDKPVMYRYNIIDHDHFDLEIHDLGIVPGETAVITMVFKRLKK